MSLHSNLELKQKNRNLRVKDSCLKAIQAYESRQGTQKEIAKLFGISEATFEKYWRQYNAASHSTKLLSGRNHRSLYKEEFRLKVMQAYEEGSSCKEVIKLFNISKITAIRYRRQHEEKHGLRPIKCKRGPELLVNKLQIKELALQYPNALMQELWLRYNETADKKISRSTVSRVIHSLGLKKEKVYTEDFCLKIVNAYESGQGTQAEIAKLFNITPQIFAKCLKQYKIANNQELTYKKDRPWIDKEKIKTLSLQHPNVSLGELCRRYNDTANKKISLGAMYRIAKYLGIEGKKIEMHPEEFFLEAIQAYESGQGTQTEIAKKFNISRSAFSKYWQQYKKMAR